MPYYLDNAFLLDNPWITVVGCGGTGGPTINQMMASLVLQVVRRMVAGTCPFMGLYLDMEQGTVTPSYATHEGVGRVVRSDAELEMGRIAT